MLFRAFKMQVVLEYEKTEVERVMQGKTGNALKAVVNVKILRTPQKNFQDGVLMPILMHGHEI